MKSNLIIILIIFLNYGYIYSQDTNKVMIGDKIYNASKEIEFDCENYGFGFFKIRFLKSSTTNHILFSTPLCGLQDVGNINGTAIIYLDDNTTIKLIDKRKYDCVNNISYTIYDLTHSEISKLKTNNIEAIRYNTGRDANLVYNKECEKFNFVGNPFNGGGQAKTFIPKINFSEIILKLYN